MTLPGWPTHAAADFSRWAFDIHWLPEVWLNTYMSRGPGDPRDFARWPLSGDQPTQKPLGKYNCLQFLQGLKQQLSTLAMLTNRCWRSKCSDGVLTKTLHHCGCGWFNYKTLSSPHSYPQHAALPTHSTVPSRHEFVDSCTFSLSRKFFKKSAGATDE